MLSLVADALGILVIGQIPVLSWVIDIPVIIMHLAYAGPVGLGTLLELVPVVGILPVFTLAAAGYEKHE
jgi:bacteriorhodopsin